MRILSWDLTDQNFVQETPSWVLQSSTTNCCNERYIAQLRWNCIMDQCRALHYWL